MFSSIVVISCFLVLLQACSTDHTDLLEEGVSWELAEYRKSQIEDLRYALSFSIPADKEADVEAVEDITLTLQTQDDVILDFREDAEKIHKIEVNGKVCDYLFTNEHLVIPSRFVTKGANHIHIAFTAGTQSLNRRDDYVYTLFVPDRARTVFPCFEQPNLKACFSLNLIIPDGWKAVSNGPNEAISGACELPIPEGYQLIHSEINNPIPTYLFAFATGVFEYQQFEEDGYRVGAYHRETDSLRIAQLPDIIHQVVFSLKWQEDFTGVKYPFPKYDLVILPGFQFGGMEHVGATFYNDNMLFLSENPTPDERLNRTELISHETSHMWFGDAVTMNWFDDVWTKEVFANYFASEITEPLFPDINHGLNWLKTYVNSAISQDRTEGRTSIRQPLSNMRYAGLIYNNIIYNKAPVMMRKMVDLMGKEAFRRGIQRYVKTYLYRNATWDDLIAILDSETPEDLKAFSRHWVDEAHWPQRKAHNFLDGRDGKEYGYIELSTSQIDSLMHYWPTETDGTARQALLMNLQENYLACKIEPAKWLSFLCDMMQESFDDELIYSSLVGYMYEPLMELDSKSAPFEQRIWGLVADAGPSTQTYLLRLLAKRAQSPEVVQHIYSIWDEGKSPVLSVNDYMTFAYELSIRLPQHADSIVSRQKARLTNPDRQAQFDFISRAVSPDPALRESLFQSLSQPDNRRIEPWTLSVLYYLNHPLRQQEALQYIEPALELLPEIQRTGDIFFPANWCSNLLSGHRSQEASTRVEHFLSTHQSYPTLLTSKILYAKYLLDRTARNTLTH